MLKNLQQAVELTKYPIDAFLFVQRGLDHTVKHIHGESKSQPQGETGTRHVTGDQLCYGIRDYAIEQYGLLAKPVLKRWHINHCEDFGHIVFALVEAGLMHKTDENSIEDFVGVFDFDETFSSKMQLSKNP